MEAKELPVSCPGDVVAASPGLEVGDPPGPRSAGAVHGREGSGVGVGQGCCLELAQQI